MTTAKKVCALLMVLAVLLTTGCGTHSETKDDTSSAADIYIEKAQKYVDEKDYAAAIDILQLGMETVDDEALEEMLGEVIELQIADTTEEKTATETEKDAETDTNDNTDAEQQVFDISKYVSTVTYWATEGMDWVYGGYALGIYISETSPDNAYFEFSYLQGAPSSRNAVASAEIPLSEITSNEVPFGFENDGWGHSGNVTLIFADDSISFVVSDVVYTDPSCPEMWGFYDVSGSLISNPTIYDDLYYTEEEYEALFGEPEQMPQEPTYDTSRASGILASFGLTEDEFKNSCQPLQKEEKANIGTIVSYNSDLLQSMRDYPSDYANGCYQFLYFTVDNKFISSDGYPCYVDESRNIRIYDYRDDVNYPTISMNNKIEAYAIFRGMQTNASGTDYLVFWLITANKE